jgi:hypothetical protein
MQAKPKLQLVDDFGRKKGLHLQTFQLSVLLFTQSQTSHDFDHRSTWAIFHAPSM